MKFDELDERMRVYETAHDYCVPPQIYMVARIDGRSFTRLTKEVCDFEVPFDEKFRDCMVETVKHLMQCGFRVVYGYTESDEISLLFHRDEAAFGRKTRKWNSILAGEASAKFSLMLGVMGCFDCRISELPNVELVVDYFRWRNEDAHRNALNSHCYWLLRKNGDSARKATSFLSGKSIALKNELLFQHGINFNDVPNWQKRGVGLYWLEHEKQAINPKTQEQVICQRNELFVDMELPMREAYGNFIYEMIAGGGALNWTQRLNKP
jgi:tRNA(His) 5'-end guanylyltransferase